MRRSGTGAETLRAIEEVGSTAVEIEADVSDEADVERLFAEGQAACGPVSVCVSNAGMQEQRPFLDLSLEDWRSHLGVNLDATFLVGRAAARAMARELAPEGIRVVAVASGAITSGGNQDAESDPHELETSEAGIPSHRLGRPEEVAELIAYLVSPEAAYITGTTVVIDGALEQQVSSS